MEEAGENDVWVEDAEKVWMAKIRLFVASNSNCQALSDFGTAKSEILKFNELSQNLQVWSCPFCHGLC